MLVYHLAVNSNGELRYITKGYLSGINLCLFFNGDLVDLSTKDFGLLKDGARGGQIPGEHGIMNKDLDYRCQFCTGDAWNRVIEQAGEFSRREAFLWISNNALIRRIKELEQEIRNLKGIK